METRLDSNKIKVFPSAMRSDTIDRNSKLLSEKNVVSIVNRLTSRPSFIIEGLTLDTVQSSGLDLVFSAGSCNIGGYLFNIDEFSVTADSNSGYIVLQLQVKKTSNYSEVYVSSDLDPNQNLDSSTKFNGILIKQVQTFTEMDEQTITDYKLITYQLPIAFYDSGNTTWKTYNTSFITNLQEVVINDINKTKINVDSIFIEPTPNTFETLENYLKYDLVIDDGDLDPVNN